MNIFKQLQVSFSAMNFYTCVWCMLCSISISWGISPLLSAVVDAKPPMSIEMGLTAAVLGQSCRFDIEMKACKETIYVSVWRLYLLHNLFSNSYHWAEVDACRLILFSSIHAGGASGLAFMGFVLWLCLSHLLIMTGKPVPLNSFSPHPGYHCLVRHISPLLILCHSA